METQSFNRENENLSLNDKLKKYRISELEYEKIKTVLGRPPEGLEWAVFSALWSEHCSYKSSKKHLKGLYRESARVLQSFGENAGIIDLGQDEKIAFKMESHNHPSFIEPYQGAATGVGGILRDIFTMGARPIALANYLCFGEPQAHRMEKLVKGVVQGIGGYGNCVGVPNITGQTNFSKSYNENILVNAFALGLFSKDDPIALSGAQGIGNLVVYVGAKTGRDGVHGASMASASFDENSASQLPTVQIGDPFYEKLLIESCLEVIGQGLVVAIQDMGAAGLTSSSFEMAEKGAVGLDLDLKKVPLRDPTMTPEDILLSESQERMLLICEPDKLEAIQQVFHRWGLDSCEIGKVTERPTLKLFWGEEPLSEMSPETIVAEAPEYDRKHNSWSWNKTPPAPVGDRVSNENLSTKGTSSDSSLDEGSSTVGPLREPAASASSPGLSSPFAIASAESQPVATLRQILKSVDGGSRQWIYNQYDQRVGAQTARDCSDPTGVVVLPSGRALSVVLGCRPWVMDWNAYVGGVDSVVYPALELATRGFEPLALTDCLNFGNPEKPEVMTQFVAALQGMDQACRALDTPIISGNVSFYNETKEKGITPTPSTGLVGLCPDVNHVPLAHFAHSGEKIFFAKLGDSHWSGLLGSTLDKASADKEASTGLGQNIDVPIENKLSHGQRGFYNEDFQKLALQLAGLRQWVRDYSEQLGATRVVGKFGLGYALARMSLPKGFGAQITTAQSLYTEPFYGFVFTVKGDETGKSPAEDGPCGESFDGQESWSSSTVVKALQAIDGLDVQPLGTVGGETLSLNGATILVSELKECYEGSWKSAFPQLS